MTSPLPQFLCPSCGDFTYQLLRDTGWCRECSGVVTRPDKTELAFSANADAVEYYMTTSETNISAWQALKKARADRPICIVCGERIERAKRHAIFCRKHKECRRYSRRYVYLYTERGFSKVEALAQIMSEL